MKPNSPRVLMHIEGIQIHIHSFGGERSISCAGSGIFSSWKHALEFSSMVERLPMSHAQQLVVTRFTRAAPSTQLIVGTAGNKVKHSYPAEEV